MGFLSYFIQYYNISRRTISQPRFFRKEWRWDDFMKHIPQDRLHQIPHKTWNSELYKRPEGNCIYNKDRECDVDAMICHYVSAAVMKKVFAAKEIRSSSKNS